MRLAKALARSQWDSDNAVGVGDSTRTSSASLNSVARQRRASRTIRRMGSALKKQMEKFKSSVKACVTAALVVLVVSGILQGAWHILLANVLFEHTQMGRAYNLVAPPLIGCVPYPRLPSSLTAANATTRSHTCAVLFSFRKLRNDDRLLHDAPHMGAPST